MTGRHVKRIMLVLSFVVVLLLNGCVEEVKVQQLAFTRIGILGPAPSEPGLFIIASAADFAMFSGQLPTNSPLLQQLRQLDYEREFAVAVRDSRGDRTFHVDRITRVDDKVSIHASFNPEGNIFGAMTYFTEIISVRKEGPWRRSIQFGLIVESKTTVKTTHRIP